ncbi:hypothetical protein WAI453_008990 [Rhynchosporium graminicola]
MVNKKYLSDDPELETDEDVRDIKLQNIKPQSGSKRKSLDSHKAHNKKPRYYSGSDNDDEERRAGSSRITNPGYMQTGNGLFAKQR